MERFHHFLNITNIITILSLILLLILLLTILGLLLKRKLLAYNYQQWFKALEERDAVKKRQLSYRNDI